MARQRRPTFLRNHGAAIAAMDLLVVPTIGFRLLFVLIIVAHHRRRIVAFGVTAHPTAEWVARSCPRRYGSSAKIANLSQSFGVLSRHRRSVGVSRQYCGQLGKQDNCQVAVTMSIANHSASLPISFRLYLPQDWAADAARRHAAGVPAAIAFQTKPEIALAQLRAALAANVPRGIVLMDAGYGNNTRLRTEISELGLPYVAGILSNTTVWTAGTLDRSIQVKDLASSLPAEAWQNIAWREASADWLSSRFARVRVRAAHCDAAARRQRADRSRAEEWLLIEWPADEREPSKYWLATLPEDITFECLVDFAKLAGALSATTTTSSKKWVSIILKDDDGAAFTTTPRSASPHTAS